MDKLVDIIKEIGLNELAKMPLDVLMVRMNLDVATAENVFKIVRLLKETKEQDKRLNIAGF